MSLPRTKYFEFPVALALLVICSQGFSQEEIIIDAIPLTIDRFNTSSFESPANVTVITSEDIERSGAKNVPDLLIRAAGIFTSMDFFGNASNSVKVDLRGFGAVADENTLILLDGRRLKDNDLSSVDWASIPMKFINRVEISRGGGAVLYGRGATAGVINIVTTSSGKLDNQITVDTSVGGLGTRALDASISRAGERTGLTINTHSYVSDNYRRNNNESRHGLRLGYQYFRDSLEVQLRLGSSSQNVRLPGSLIIQPNNGTDEVADLGRRGSTKPDDYARALESFVDVDLLKQGKNAQMIVNAGWRSSSDESFFEGFDAVSGTYAERDTSRWHISPRVRYMLETELIKNDFKVGVDYESWNVSRNEATSERNSSRPHNIFASDQKNYAVYLANNISISDNWAISLGAREERQTQDATDVFDNTAPNGLKFSSGSDAKDQSLNVSARDIGLEYTFPNSTRLGANMTESFRLANIDEIGATGGENNASFIREFQFLRPQITNTHQIFLRKETTRLSTNINFYHIDTHDEIRLDQLTAGAGNTNFPVTKRQGVELSTKYSSDRLTLSSNYKYTKAKFSTGRIGGGFVAEHDLTGNTIPLVPKHSFNLNGTYALPQQIDLTMNLAYFSEQIMDNDEPNIMHTNIPGFSVTNIEVSKKTRLWRMGLSISNLFDRDYHSYAVASGFTATRFGIFPKPERVFTISLSRDFEY